MHLTPPTRQPCGVEWTMHQSLWRPGSLIPRKLWLGPSYIYAADIWDPVLAETFPPVLSMTTPLRRVAEISGPALLIYPTAVEDRA